MTDPVQHQTARRQPLTIEDTGRALLGPVLAEVLKQRTAAGVAKYGQRLDQNHQPDRAKAVHLVQEELDAMQYALWLGNTRKAARHATEAEITAATYDLTLEEIMNGGKR